MKKTIAGRLGAGTATASAEPAPTKIPNKREQTAAKNRRRQLMHTTRFATAPNAPGRLSAVIDRARAGIRNARPDRRDELADQLAGVIKSWCDQQGMP